MRRRGRHERHRGGRPVGPDRIHSASHMDNQQRRRGHDAMTVRVQWDDDEPKTGLPDSGEDTKTYEETEASGQVTLSHEQSGATQTVTFNLPLLDGGEVTPDKTEVDPAGDEAARTISVSGTGFPASTEGTVTLMTG